MPRRILVLNERDPENPLAGGAETHIFEIFSRLAAAGHEVTLLAAAFPGGAREANVRGVRVLRLTNRYLYYLVVAFAARRELRRRRYDVVVDVLNKLPFLSPWTAGARVPCFAIVHHLFGTTAFSQVPFPVALVTWASEKLIPYAYRDTPMLAISPSTKDDLVERGVRADHVWVVPPGVDHAAYAAADPRSRREPLILWIGRLEPYKRCDVMLESMPRIRERVPNARLVIVGEGSARPALTERAVALGIRDAVELTGFVSEAEKIAWLARASVVVNTSEKEGWGMTVIEGNACGAPSVSTNVPGLRDSVRHDDTGLLVPFGDERALADAIVTILTDEARRARMVERALHWAARFSWDNVAADTLALIEEAITPSGTQPRLAASPFQVA
jgi:glycosyltransferase involved in cell wall biosynthesis